MRSCRRKQSGNAADSHVADIHAGSGSASGEPAPKKRALLLWDFYATPCEKLARQLLGKSLVRRTEDDKILVGRIVEVEAYLGGDDKGSHSYNGRRTERNKAMFMPPGTAYVYIIYGTHHCLNISSDGEGAAVLIRAVEPLEGLEAMRQRRGAKRKDRGAGIKDWDLCSGPANICQGMNISKDSFDGKDLMDESTGLWLEDTADATADWVISAPRVGIDYAGPEWASKPLRFYLMSSKSVTTRDKSAEVAVSATASV